MIPLHIEQQIKTKVKDKELAKRLLWHKIQQSDKLYGKWTHKGFHFDPNKTPILDIPDLTDFKLKAYVSVHTPSLNNEEDVVVEEQLAIDK